jgi:uncharacterized phage protein (TIGR01671 family)
MEDRFKVRGYHKVLKQMFYLDEYWNDDWYGCSQKEFKEKGYKGGTLSNNNKTLCPLVNHLTGSLFDIMQCTGKKDENNELVFQDDFLASLDYGEDSYFIRIMWDKDLCKFYCAFWNDTHKYWERHDESDEIIEEMDLYEVVSNIHEHPELLEE